MSRITRFVALSFAATALLGGAIACGDGGSSEDSTATAVRPAKTTPAQPTPIATTSGGPNEGGEAPTFWRTADNFTSVTAGQPYTVLFRITNGYDEPQLVVKAACPTCEGGRQTVTFEGLNSPPFPAGSDLPGSYYPMNLVFPEADRWYLTVQAGPDEVTVTIDVQETR